MLLEDRWADPRGSPKHMEELGLRMRPVAATQELSLSLMHQIHPPGASLDSQDTCMAQPCVAAKRGAHTEQRGPFPMNALLRSLQNGRFPSPTEPKGKLDAKWEMLYKQKSALSGI